MNIEIKPLEGLGSISFGATTVDINAVLGEPLAMEDVPTDDAVETLVLAYDNGISVFLEGETEPIVSNFDITNTEAKLYGRAVFDMSSDAIVELMNANGFCEMDEAVEEWGELRLSFEEALVDFYFENNQLISVNFAVMTNEKGEILK